MGAFHLTVQVFNISPKATSADVVAFFVYYGTLVDDIQLRSDGYQSQVATVTFQQPYAFQTALLLNGSLLAGRRVRIMPIESLKEIPVESGKYSENINAAERHGGGSTPTASAVQAVAVDLFSRTKEQVSGAGRVLSQQAILAAEQTLSKIKSAFAGKDGSSVGTLRTSSPKTIVGHLVNS